MLHDKKLATLPSITDGLHGPVWHTPTGIRHTTLSTLPDMQLSCPALSSVPSTSLMPHCCRWISAHCSGGASPVVSIPRPSIAQAASAPATGFSDGATAPTACPATQPTPPAARKPRSKPQLTTCRLRAGAALAAFAAAGIELSVGAMLPALTEAEASSLLASGLIQRPPRCPERSQERRAWRDSEDSLARLQLDTKEIHAKPTDLQSRVRK